METMENCDPWGKKVPKKKKKRKEKDDPYDCPSLELRGSFQVKKWKSKARSYKWVEETLTKVLAKAARISGQRNICKESFRNLHSSAP